MSWTDLAPANTDKATAKALCTMSVKEGATKRLVLTIRPYLASDLSWCQVGAAVHVQFGSDEHTGRLRVSPGGAHRLGWWGGRAKVDDTRSLCLIVPLLPGMANQRQGATLVEAFPTADELQVVLPAWARGGASATPLPKSVPAPQGKPTAAKSPFVMQGGDSHAPLYEGRRGSGPVPL